MSEVHTDTLRCELLERRAEKAFAAADDALYYIREATSGATDRNLEDAKRAAEEAIEYLSGKNDVALSGEVPPSLLRVLQERLKAIEEFVRYHRDQKGDDRCWGDDQKLYALVLGDEPWQPEMLLKSTFLSNCSHYWECQTKGLPYVTPSAAPSAYNPEKDFALADERWRNYLSNVHLDLHADRRYVEYWFSIAESALQWMKLCSRTEAHQSRCVECASYLAKLREEAGL